MSLRDRDPRLQPTLRMGWLESDGGRDVAVAAGRELMALARTPPLAEVLRSWPNQDDADHPLRTLEAFHHPVGTCRMGPASDPTAVIDGDGRVHGLQGLWVMDASIVPRIPWANTHLLVIALAERLAGSFLAAVSAAEALPA